MIFAGRQNLVGKCAPCGILVALVGVALLSGCKGNTQAASAGRHTGKPPVVAARLMATGGAERNDPLADTMWREAEWWPLVAPANTARTTPPSRAAVRYDAGTLYVAVINEMPEAGVEAEEDVVSLFIDTSGEGKEMLQVTTDGGGGIRATWIRASTPVEPREDGSPNVGHPLDIRPDIRVAGLGAKVGRGLSGGREAWTVVLAVPVTGMPAVMQALPEPGKRWRFNVLRSVTQRGEQYQANLSPVYVNAQAASAYRMAELEFAGE
jgi:hypothetical protein